MTCPRGQSHPGVRAECRVGGPKRKHRGVEDKRTRQKVWWGSVRNANSGESTPHPKLSQILGSRRGWPASCNTRSCCPAYPAATRRGRAQRALDAGGPRVVPTPRGQSDAAPGTELPPTEAARPPVSSPLIDSEEAGSTSDWKRRELDLTASPSQVGRAILALGQPAGAQAGVREAGGDVSAEISTG